MARRSTKLKAAEAELLAMAKTRGLENNYLFVTTLARYRVQVSIMAELEKQIDDSGMLVTKEYVKGRENLYTNPAIGEYNKTATAANGTAVTLINIINKVPATEDKKESKLTAFIAENE